MACDRDRAGNRNLKDHVMAPAPFSPVALRTALLAGLLALAAAPAFAQSIVATVNGDPVTSSDVDDRMKMLRAMRKPASRETALEDLIGDSLRNKELKKFSVVAGDGDITQELIRESKEAKLQPQALAAALQRSGLPQNHIRSHWQAMAGFNYYVRARNRNLEPSDAEIRAEMVAQGKTARSTDYRLQEVLFLLPANASGALANQRGQEALKFRPRFTDCQGGAELARALPEVAVKPALTRNSSSLTDALKKLLDGVPAGHLSPPQREAGGILMIAVCEKKETEDLASVREAIAGTLLDRKLAGENARLYQELRSRAVIVKR